MSDKKYLFTLIDSLPGTSPQPPSDTKQRPDLLVCSSGDMIYESAHYPDRQIVACLWSVDNEI